MISVEAGNATKASGRYRYLSVCDHGHGNHGHGNHRYGYHPRSRVLATGLMTFWDANTRSEWTTLPDCVGLLLCVLEVDCRDEGVCDQVSPKTSQRLLTRGKLDLFEISQVA